MQSSDTKAWVRRLQVGTFELSDLQAFEKLCICDMVQELAQSHPVRFLDRSHGNKREIGVAQGLRRSNRWTTGRLVDCLLFTSEFELLTTIARMTNLRFRPSRQSPGIMELISGAGFSVYHDPDGWRIKLLHERTVPLKTKTLKERGWLLDEIQGNEREQQRAIRK
jgi:hypothetical protein